MHQHNIALLNIGALVSLIFAPLAPALSLRLSAFT